MKESQEEIILTIGFGVSLFDNMSIKMETNVLLNICNTCISIYLKYTYETRINIKFQVVFGLSQSLVSVLCF